MNKLIQDVRPSSVEGQAQNNKGFSQVILLGIVAVIILIGAGSFLLFPEDKTSLSEKMARQEVSSENVTNPIEPTLQVVVPSLSPTTVSPTAPSSTNEKAKMSSIFGIPCISNPSIIFDQTFAPLEQILYIIPSGAAAGEEIKPHSYVDLAVESIPLYAPVDMELVQGAYYYEPPTFKVLTTYSFNFQVSCEVVLMLDHVTDPVDKIKALFPKTPQQDTHTSGVFSPTLKLKKGELIGYTKGGGNQIANINRFDLGLYVMTHLNTFVNQSRYEVSKTWKYLYAVCPYDYFAPVLKNEYRKKFATLNKISVPEAPCRNPNQDKAGTLSGAWFFQENSSAIDPHVGISTELDDNSVIIVGLPKQGGFISIPRGRGTFKDPKEVTIEHCYFSPESGNQVVYFRLLSYLKAEVYMGIAPNGCPDSFPSSGNTFFLYR